MKASQDKIDVFILDLISKSKNKDCYAIINTKEYKEIKEEFLKYISADELKIQNIFKGINSTCYHISKYIIKFGDFHIPEHVEKQDWLVPIYHRANYKISYDNKVIYLGFEIQDYIDSEEYINEDEMFNLYCHIRDNKYRWVDIKRDNLKKKNGKLYVIDSDYIYKEGEENLYNESILSKKFETQYQAKKEVK